MFCSLLCVLVGDWLSMRVDRRAQASQADGAIPEERKYGLVRIMADFHAQLDVICLA